MRWSIIRLIWFRELRDQLRDRRTIFMIAVLPILLYPVAGFGVMQLALGFLSQKSTIGIARIEELSPWASAPPPGTPGLAMSGLASTPGIPGSPFAACSLSFAQLDDGQVVNLVPWLTMPLAAPLDPGGISPLASAMAFQLGRTSLNFPPLLDLDQGRPVFLRAYRPETALVGDVEIRPVPEDASLADLQALLDTRRIDLLLILPRGFQTQLLAGGTPLVTLKTRERDETARLVGLRVTGVLARWRRDLRQVRLARLGVASDFDMPFHVTQAESAQPASQVDQDNLYNILVRVFPFVLVMWSLAGALYPAVDLCAGEKERGTMETLLISPVSREEIVYGKFLTIWVFSAGTALLNLLSMALTTSQLGGQAGGAFRLLAFFWAVVLLLPLSAFFSAVCLAVGAYARSSKEGQYYLMPLFLLTMPLIFLTLAPGVELNPFYSMVPVTGVALLLQKLMVSVPGDRTPWFYFLPVLAPMIIYSWLALRWAIGQFQSEEVLFREAERLDIGLWLSKLLRDKESTPSSGEAFFCFVFILVLRWVSFGVGQNLSLLTRTGIGLLAFVLTPPLFMALLLTTRPLRGLGLRWPPWWAWPVAGLLALLVVPPLAELTSLILQQFPGLRDLLELNHPLTRELRELSRGVRDSSLGSYFLVLAVLPAICEELAFRGFILQGLLRSFRPWTAILLSAFLFSVYQMNVFQFLPHFVFGVILALVVVRTGSVFPAMLFHLVYNGTLLLPLLLLPRLDPGLVATASKSFVDPTQVRMVLSLTCALLAALGLFVLWRVAPNPEREREGKP